MSFRLNNLGFSYPNTHSPILHDISLEIKEGESVSVLGNSGIGKSTLIAVLGLLTNRKTISGNVHFKDLDGMSYSYRDLQLSTADKLRREQFGFAFQSSYLLPHLSVIENLIFPLGLLGISTTERNERAHEFLEIMDDLPAIKDHLVSEISGGQKQRIAVLRALIHHPMVVFADEPFSALDDKNKELILQTLSDWHSGKLPGQDTSSKRILFLVCHDLQVAKNHANFTLELGMDYQFSLIQNN